MNERKTRNKINFLKKYFPKFRTQPEESISNLKEYFFRFEYVKGNKIIIDGEFDEYIYIILKGSCAAIKKIKRVPGLKENLSVNGISDATHVVLEKYGK
jgi:signal-transduction protein with cAMP-binding, CBS, and nucleotidyltransferase domain